MEVMFQSSGHVLITLLRGDIDHHTASALRQTIDQSMKEFGCSDLVMDFSGVGFMDSAGIGVVLGRYKKLMKTGVRICVSGCSPHVARLLEMAGVFSLVQRADTRMQAESMLQSQPQMTGEV